MHKNIVAVYFSDPGKRSYPFDTESYFNAYRYLDQRLSEQGVQMIVVRGDSYQGKGVFTWGWRFNTEGTLEKVEQQIAAAVIWNRDDKDTIPYITDAPIINHPEFDQICLDKLRTAELFPVLSPLTKNVDSYQELLRTLNDWEVEPDEKVVLKDNFETEGRGIFIKPRKELAEDIYDDWSDVMVQEFCDSSSGVAGLVEGTHDIRVVLLEGTPITAFVRQPPEGKWKANVAQGGSYFYIDVEHDIPDDLRQIVANLDQRLSKYAYRLYGADFFKCKRGWRLIELNSRPGIEVPEQKHTKLYFDSLVKLLTRAATQSSSTATS